MSKTLRKKNTQKQSDKQMRADRRGNRIVLIILAFGGLLTLAIGAGLIAYSSVKYKYTKAGPLETEQVFVVPNGAGMSKIAAKLEKDGLIESANIFKLVVRYEGDEAGLKAGEYNVSPKASMKDIYEILHEGKAILYPITIPEGQSVIQVMRIIDAMPTLIDDNPPPPPEGSLLPETYMTPRGMTQSALIAKMQKAQTDVIDTLWEYRHKDLPINTKAEAINLASIVEKETGVKSEHDRVAAVFVNRLNRGMRLESDPTIIYGVTKGLPLYNKKGQRRTLYRSEIDRKTAWNTYQIDGLPETPICNPGKAAIAAVLQPGTSDEIFFVADGKGGHVFSTNLRDHVKNVKAYRRYEAAAQKRQRAEK